MIQRLLPLICLLAFAAGCTTRLVDFTVISTKNVDWSQASTFKRGKNRIEGRDTIHIIVFIPTGVPNMKEAVDRAIESVPGAVALVDGVLLSKAWYIPYIYGRSSYVVEGSPLIDPALASNASEPETDYVAAYCDRQGKVKTLSYLTRSEYESLRQKAIPNN
jgi:hypothetical protein